MTDRDRVTEAFLDACYCLDAFRDEIHTEDFQFEDAIEPVEDRLRFIETVRAELEPADENPDGEVPGA